MSEMHHIEALIAGQSRESKAHWEGLRREIGARFDAVDDRLTAIDEKQRIANGRVTTMEQALTRVDERIGQLQKADGDKETRLDELDRRLRHHRRATDKPGTPVALHMRASDRGGITQRDVNIVIGTLTALGGVIAFFAWLVPAVKGLFS